MRQTPTNTSRRILTGFALAVTTASLAAGPAHAATATYVLDDVWLLPDITHPGAPPALMTGTIEWTYDEGDFENGSGTFTELSVPWWGDGMPPLAWTIETSMVEITMPGKFHDLGVDVTLRFLEPLSIDGPSPIDTDLSQFEIEVGISHAGHIISGSAIPVGSPCPADLDDDGLVGFDDLLAVLAAWGPCDGCPTDIGGDGIVGFDDLLDVLSSWGPCPT